jgi:hypothetical protein
MAFFRLGVLVVAGLAFSSTAAASTLGPMQWGSAVRVDRSANPNLQPVPGIACPSVSLCVVSDGAGNVSVSHNPAGGSRAWAVAHIDSNALETLMCPSKSLCVGLDTASDVVTSTHPAGAASAWSISPIPGWAPGNGYAGLSCPSVSLCVGWLSTRGDVIVSTDPADGPGAWHVEHIDSSSVPCGGNHPMPPTDCAGEITAMSCPLTSLCVAVDSNGYAVVSTDPRGGASTWSTQNIDPESNLQKQYDPLQQVSCPSVSLCVAADWVGNLVTSTDPSDGASAWNLVPVEPNHYGFLTDLSCPSARLCLGGDYAGRVLGSTNPAGGRRAWKRFDIGAAFGGFGLHVACPSAMLCAVVDGGGSAFSSTNPVGGARAWGGAHIDETTNLTALSCPSTSLCVAVDVNGDVVVGRARNGTLTGGILFAGGPAPAPGHQRRLLSGLVSIFTTKGHLVARQHVRAGHRFRLMLAAGRYLLNVGPNLHPNHNCRPVPANVRPHHSTRVNVQVGCRIK